MTPQELTNALEEIPTFALRAQYIERQGFEKCGEGSTAHVYTRPDIDWVAKLKFSERLTFSDAYETYVDMLCEMVEDEGIAWKDIPMFPVILYTRPWVTCIEKLQKWKTVNGNLTNIEQIQMLTFLKTYLEAHHYDETLYLEEWLSELPESRRSGYRKSANLLEETFRWKQENVGLSLDQNNILVRPSTGDLVLVDPVV